MNEKLLSFPQLLAHHQYMDRWRTQCRLCRELCLWLKTMRTWFPEKQARLSMGPRGREFTTFSAQKQVFVLFLPVVLLKLKVQTHVSLCGMIDEDVEDLKAVHDV